MFLNFYSLLKSHLYNQFLIQQKILTFNRLYNLVSYDNSIVYKIVKRQDFPYLLFVQISPIQALVLAQLNTSGKYYDTLSVQQVSWAPCPIRIYSPLLDLLQFAIKLKDYLIFFSIVLNSSKVRLMFILLIITSGILGTQGTFVKILRSSSKTTQKNYTKKIFMTQITKMV